MAEVGGIRGNADDDKDANGDICCECLGEGGSKRLSRGGGGIPTMTKTQTTTIWCVCLGGRGRYEAEG